LEDKALNYIEHWLLSTN